MSDKHDRHDKKQKASKTKAHLTTPEPARNQDFKSTQVAGEIKAAGGKVQEDLGKFRATANHAHQG